MAVLWPTVKARVITALPTLPGGSDWTIYDGPPTELPAKYVTVGYTAEGEFGGALDMPDSSVDTLREESGAVVLEVVAWSGDDDLPAKEASVFALFDALDAWVRADQTLGVMTSGSTSTLAATYTPVLTKGSGSTARLAVTLTYLARH